MKRIATALVALSLSAAAVQAAGLDPLLFDRHGYATAAAATTELVEVKAGSVMTAKELAHAGLSADDLVQVTDYSAAQPRINNER